MPAATLTREWTPSASGRPIPGLTGWYESDLAPRLSVLAHESGRARPVRVRRVGWLRPQPAVLMADGTERKFGTLVAACAFALSVGE